MLSLSLRQSVPTIFQHRLVVIQRHALLGIKIALATVAVVLPTTIAVGVVLRSPRRVVVISTLLTTPTVISKAVVTNRHA